MVSAARTVQGMLNGVELVLPGLLLEMVESGRWPNERGRDVDTDQVRTLAGYCGLPLHLSPPPFRPIAEWEQSGGFFTWGWAAPDGLDHQKAISIADFGLGADSPIVLDYRENPARPSVLYLSLGPRTLRLREDRRFLFFRRRRMVAIRQDDPRYDGNKWAFLAASFKDFIEAAGL
jgi:hypothetical protein